jgi:GH43 family beta-xylosidase
MNSGTNFRNESNIQNHCAEERNTQGAKLIAYRKTSGINSLYFQLSLQGEDATHHQMAQLQQTSDPHSSKGWHSSQLQFLTSKLDMGQHGPSHTANTKHTRDVTRFPVLQDNCKKSISGEPVQEKEKLEYNRNVYRFWQPCFVTSI